MKQLKTGKSRHKKLKSQINCALKNTAEYQKCNVKKRIKP
jgi:hypothetical protein